MVELRRMLVCPFCGEVLQEREAGGLTRPTCPGCGFRQHANPVPAVNAAVVWDDRVLLVQRRHDPYRGAWALPGGFVEWDEEPADTAVRECHEETGVAVVLTGRPVALLAGDDPRGNTVSITYPGRPASAGLDDPRAGDDAAAAAWYPLGGIPDLAFENHARALHLLGIPTA